MNIVDTAQSDFPNIIVFDPPAALSNANTRPTGILGVKVAVAQRFADPLSLKDLAEAAEMPRNTLTRYFNKIYGTTPMRWLWSFRTILAAEMIKQSPNLSLTDIAIHCGFSSSAHFSRRFRQLWKSTPSEHKLNALSTCLAADQYGNAPAVRLCTTDNPLLGVETAIILRAMAQLEALTEKATISGTNSAEQASTAPST